MAIVQDALTVFTGTTGTVNSKTFTHTTVAALTNIYVPVFNDAASNDVTGVTCDGVAMTQIMTVLKQGSAAVITYLYGIKGITNGAHSIVVSRTTNSVDQLLAAAVSYSGVDQAATFSVVGTGATASGTSVSGSVTTTIANSIGLAVSYCDNRNISASTGSTLLTANAGAVGQIALLESSTFPIVSPGSYSMAVTCTSGSNGIRVIAIAPAATATSFPDLRVYFM